MPDTRPAVFFRKSGFLLHQQVAALQCEERERERDRETDRQRYRQMTRFSSFTTTISSEVFHQLFFSALVSYLMVGRIFLRGRFIAALWYRFKRKLQVRRLVLYRTCLRMTSLALSKNHFAIGLIQCRDTSL